MKSKVTKSFGLLALAVAIFSGCSDSDKDTAGGATDGGNAVANVSISGMAQKGPFAAGSKIIAYELEDESLTQTGKAFVGKTDKDGSFKLNNVSLISQYAILEGTGYFNNEITGKKSAGQIILNAVVDLTEREQVNINLLTQLEYDRVVYLVTNKNMSVVDAKKQAQRELAKAFFNVDETIEFEDLDIFGESEWDAMLLALSVLTLSNNSDADFSELLAEFSADIEKDGTVDDVERQTGMADFAALYMDLPSIRENVKKFSTSGVPNFEKYVREYYSNIYGLGDCTEKNEGEVKKNENKGSARRNAGFVCEDGSWKITLFNPDYEYGSFTDKRDGYTYRTTTIGDQTWFAENLRYRVTDSTESYFCYNNSERYCDIYGVYYSYQAVSCPEGWHVPTREEWSVLFETVGGMATAAKKLRSRGGWDVNKHPSVADDKDEFGFSALPAGVYYFGDEGNSVYFRTSDLLINTQGEALDATYNVGINAGDSLWIGNSIHTTATSVRCLKDKE